MTPSPQKANLETSISKIWGGGCEPVMHSLMFCHGSLRIKSTTSEKHSHPQNQLFYFRKITSIYWMKSCRNLSFGCEDFSSIFNPSQLKNIFNLCKQMSFTHTGKKSKFYSAQIFFSVPDLEHHQFDVFLWQSFEKASKSVIWLISLITLWDRSNMVNIFV